MNADDADQKKTEISSSDRRHLRSSAALHLLALAIHAKNQFARLADLVALVLSIIRTLLGKNRL